MPTANINVKNVAAIRVHIEVRDLNDNDDLVFDSDLDPQEVSGPIEVEPHPEQLDYQISWRATAKGYAGEGEPYVEYGETVDVTVSPQRSPGKSLA